MRKLAILAAFSACAVNATAQAADYAVADVQSLQAAIASARSGDMILLAEGDYGALNLDRNNPLSPGVTVTAATAGNKPRFSAIRIDGIGEFTLSRLKVEYGPTQSPSSAYAVEFRNASNVRFEESEIVSAEDGVSGNDAYGVFVSNSANVSVLRNMIRHVYRGVAIFDSDDIAVEENSITNAGADGIVGRGLLRVRIVRNYLADFDIVDVADPHPDAIQLWTRGASRANVDVKIEGNLIRRGGGEPTQGILVGGADFVASQILIAENVIEQSMAQGILVSNVAATAIRDNTVIPANHRTDAPGIDIRSNGVSLDRNLAATFRLPPGVSGPNALGQENVRADYNNPWVPEFVGNIILNPANPSDPNDYAALTSVGASAFVRSTWLGDPSIPDGSLMPPATIADIDFAGGAIDRASDPLSLTPAIDKYGAPYVVSAPAAKLTAALGLSIDARLRASPVAGYKYAAVVSGSYDLRVDQGRVLFSVWTAGGVTRLGATAPALKDLAAHDVKASFDGVAGVMTISVDGVEAARRAAPLGPIAYHPSYKLYAGGAPWGGSLDGRLERLAISR